MIAACIRILEAKQWWEMLRDRIRGVVSRAEAHQKMQRLSPGEENALVDWIVDWTLVAVREIFESLAFELNPRVESVCLGPTRESNSLAL